MKKRVVTGLLVICLLSVGVIPAAQAISLGDVLKVGGVGILISKFATPLNSFINTLTFKHGAGTDYATKVVPILTIGTGGYIGAAQVIGSQDLVDRTEAVIQIEADFNSQFRVKALIPIDSKNPVNFSRVNGVGVSAIIDIRI
ncbi:MAG: hypothetical protein P4N41_24705 [Negativicutes bacterium]|nr:hypothetical protein [Negativicutes bacterium]MDR3592872.1 hypothetical protein [Negativicutes bacterium]